MSLESELSTLTIPGKYETKGELFFHFANDVIWYQQEYIDAELKQKLNQSQRSRKEQRTLLAGIDALSLNTFFDVIDDLSKEQLEEYLAILSKLNKTKVEVTASRHATSIYVNSPLMLGFYDPNVPVKLPDFNSSKNLAFFIKRVKYEGLGKLKPNGTMSVQIISYKNQHFLENEFEYYSLDEIRKQTDTEIELAATRSPNQFTPYHVAVLMCSVKNIASMNEMRKWGINHKDKNGDTPLEMAIKQKKWEVVLELLKSELLDLSSGNTLKLLLGLPNNERDRLMPAILKHPLKNYQDLLIQYILDDNVEMVGKFLERGVPIDEPVSVPNKSGKRTPLHFAVSTGNCKMVKFLIEKGANFKAEDNDLLSTAIMKGHIDVLIMLIEFGANLAKADETGYTALHYAIIYRKIDIVKLILKVLSERGVFISNKAGNVIIGECTPLEFAKQLQAENVRNEMVQLIEGYNRQNEVTGAPIQPKPEQVDELGKKLTTSFEKAKNNNSSPMDRDISKPFSHSNRLPIRSGRIKKN